MKNALDEGTRTPPHFGTGAGDDDAVQDQAEHRISDLVRSSSPDVDGPSADLYSPSGYWDEHDTEFPKHKTIVQRGFMNFCMEEKKSPYEAYVSDPDGYVPSCSLCHLIEIVDRL